MLFPNFLPAFRIEVWDLEGVERLWLDLIRAFFLVRTSDAANNGSMPISAMMGIRIRRCRSHISTNL